MNAIQPQFYRSPISLPESKSNLVSINHRTVTGRTPIIGVRQALLRGCKPVDAVLSSPLTVHELCEDDYGVWMTDLPEELNQVAEMLGTIRPAGRVLVGGLGLGIVATALTCRDFVDEIVVVERSADVIALCARSGYEVIHSDLADYLQTCPEPFDFWLLDTWQGTGESVWWTEVMPLRRIIANRFGRQRVHCWAEDIMLGQAIPAATRNAGHNWYYKALPRGMSFKEVKGFFRNVGLPAWERRYGKNVDMVLAKDAA